MIYDWLGIPAAFVAWGFALYVFLVAPPTRSSRFLVAMLLVDGVAVITSYNNLTYLNPLLSHLGLPNVPLVLHQMSDWALVAVYLPFIGMTLNSPLVKPLKNPVVARLILMGGLGIAIVVPFLPEELLGRSGWSIYILICIVLAWGFIAAMHSWYIASSEVERGRAKAFTIAFGVRDVLWTITFAYYTAVYHGLTAITVEDLIDNSTRFGFLLPLTYQLAVILYVPLVAYGVLRVQLFDIDLRVKRMLRRGTVTAAFVATFFVVSELAANYLSTQLGTVLGVLCTGALVFFLDPIQRAAESFSNSAMPNTVNTPEYESFRKLQVYDSALRATLEDGKIGERERLILNSMVASMGIDPSIARRMEEDLNL
ncbi:MAG: hypothetical protein ABJ056_11660 [Halioglobus sp.]